MFVIVVLGGLGSVPGAIAGGVLLGWSNPLEPSMSRFPIKMPLDRDFFTRFVIQAFRTFWSW